MYLRLAVHKWQSRSVCFRRFMHSLSYNCHLRKYSTTSSFKALSGLSVHFIYRTCFLFVRSWVRNLSSYTEWNPLPITPDFSAHLFPSVIGHPVTDCRCSVGGTCPSYSGGFGFEAWPQTIYYVWEFSCISSDPPDRHQDGTSSQTATISYQLSVY